MINRFFSVICCLAIVTLFVITGCQQQHKPEPVVYEPLFDPNFIVPNYAFRAMKATGGLQAWADTKEIKLDSVVTFYKPDRSFYLTEHHYEIHPWQNSIRILNIEPQGQFLWQLSDGSFTVFKDGRQIDTGPVVLRGQNFAEMMFNMITAPIRFLDDSVEFTPSYTPIRIEGLWYYPIERSYRIIQPSPDDIDVEPKPIEPHWSEVIFYQSKPNSLVDMLWFAGIEGEKFLTV